MATRKEKLFTGISLNSGSVLAKVCLYSAENYNRSAAHKHIRKSSIQREISRYELACSNATKELKYLANSAKEKIGDAESRIFTVQGEILNDPSIKMQVISNIRNNLKTSEWALYDVFEEYEHKIRVIQNPYFSERSSDIVEIRNLLLNKLFDTVTGFKCQGHNHCSKGDDKIIIASELTAEMMVNMNLNRVLGIVTEHGGISSHAAIIARSIGIPAVCGVKDIFDNVKCGSQLLINGDAGTVLLNPSKESIAAIISFEEKENQAESLHVKSPEGTKIYANASLIEDVQNADKFGADGIGLFRTEISIMRHNRFLNEDEQYEMYRPVIDIMGSRPVTFRLMDIGGDKELPFLNIAKEINPSLGLRGARFLLQNGDIFSTQLRAILKLSNIAPIKIMFPMVIDSTQLDTLLTASKQVMSGIDYKAENIRFGAMLEVPSAILDSVKIMKMSDFVSIGSNDLIQYLFAVDRNNDLVANEYDPEHYLLWNVINRLGKEASKLNTPISICGEMAGRKGLSSKLINSGIKELSVNARLVQKVKKEIIEKIS